MDIIDINTFFGAFPSQHAVSTPQALIADLDRFKVQRALAVSTIGLFYDDQTGNQETLGVAGQSGGRLLPVATINPATHLAGVDAAIERIAAGPFAMCRFFPGMQNWPVDYAPFGRALKLLAERKKPAMISIGGPGEITALARMAAGSETPIILSRVHGATLVEAMAAMKEHPSFYLDTHLLQIPDGLARIKDLVGADRLLFGSGASAHSLGAALAYVQRSSLSDTEKAAVLGGNAAKLLGGGR